MYVYFISVSQPILYISYSIMFYILKVFQDQTQPKTLKITYLDEKIKKNFIVFQDKTQP